MDKSPKSSIENQAVLALTPSVTIGQPSRAIAEANSRNIDPTEPTPACATMLAAPTGAANEFNSAVRGLRDCKLRLQADLSGASGGLIESMELVPLPSVFRTDSRCVLAAANMGHALV